MNSKKFDNKFLYLFYKLQKLYKNKTPNNHFAEFAEDVMINRIFKNHDKSIFDIFAFSFGPEKKDKWREEVKKHPEKVGKLHITEDSFTFEFNDKNNN